MKTQFRVINRVSRKEQIFNSDELQNFFKYLGNGKYNNKWRKQTWNESIKIE